uniref:RPN1 N-terminal domain-containing protein n=1 Tax=Oryza nivara TaxID=4536 RepID=A0A0E0HS37_ORYNI
MTSVPKPLKLLQPHYGTLKSYHETMPESSDSKVFLLLGKSVLAFQFSNVSNTPEKHEYVQVILGEEVTFSKSL